MKKPSDIAIWLVENEPFHTMHIEYRATGVDTAASYVMLTGNQKVREFELGELVPYVIYRPTHCSVLEIKREVRDDYEKWKKFEKNNVEELAIYRRLKAKFEGVS